MNLRYYGEVLVSLAQEDNSYTLRVNLSRSVETYHRWCAANLGRGRAADDQARTALFAALTSPRGEFICYGCEPAWHAVFSRIGKLGERRAEPGAG